MSDPRKSVTREHSRDSGMALCLLCFLAGSVLHVRWLETMAMGVLVADMIVPTIFKPFAYVWFGLATAIGNVMSSVMLSLVFFLVVTPIGVVRRWLGFDPMQGKRWRRGQESVFKVRDHLYVARDIQRPY